MSRIFLAVLIIIAGCKSFETNNSEREDISNRMNTIIENVSSKVLYSVQSFGDTVLYPRSTKDGKEWKTVPIRDWTSGFFPGILWYIYELTNNNSFKIKAEKWTEGLTSIQNYSGSHDIGFMIYCSFGNGFRLTNNINYRDVIVQTANTLMTRFNPKVGCIRSWDNRKWAYPVIIDNMMNLELLFWASQNGGTKKMYDVAVKHAETTMLNHFRNDGSTFHVLSYDTANGNVLSKGTHQGFSDASCWARGQAWAVYGFTMAYRFTKDQRFLKTARKAADYFIAHLPKDKVPFWDFNVPNTSDEPRDASAAAIVSSALLELSNYGNDLSLQKKYYENGISILESLLSDSYFTKRTNSLGLINHAVGNKPGNGEVDVSLIYGDYYFLEALIRYKNSNGKFALK